MKRAKKKSTNALDVWAILISAIADFLVGIALLVIERIFF